MRMKIARHTSVPENFARHALGDGEMKGALLLGKLFNMFLNIAVGTALVIVLLVVAKFAGDAHRYDMTVSIYYNPLKYETAFLSFLEVTDPESGLPMKDIIAAAVAQRSDTFVWVDGKIVDVKSATGSQLAVLLGRPFFLRSTDPELRLGGSAEGFRQKVYKVSTRLFKPDGKTTGLELYVG